MGIRAARSEDARSIARVHIDSWRTTYAGMVPADFLSSLSHPKGVTYWEGILTKAPAATATFVAETPDAGVVGFVRGGPKRDGHQGYQAAIYAIYLLESFQRRGLGRLLIAALTRRFAEDGLGSMLVWVLEDNPAARGFYEALGGETLGARTITIGGRDLTEVSYGWRDIESLRE